MKKKTIIAGIIISVFLIGIVSASLIDIFGKITGSVEVNGPVFYTSSENKLLINDASITYTDYAIINGNAIVFWTEENLGGIDFNYIPKVNLSIRANVSTPTNPKPLELIFGYSNTLSIMNEICSLKVDISTEDLYFASCNGSSVPKNVNKFYYKIQGEGDPTIEYFINTKGTKAEILGVVI